ncbi:MAG UNVERIFIED_CONTAM: hypothetical protein LVT10_25465 [Anaerolineae bacterium]
MLPETNSSGYLNRWAWCYGCDRQPRRFEALGLEVNGQLLGTPKDGLGEFIHTLEAQTQPDCGFRRPCGKRKYLHCERD